MEDSPRFDTTTCAPCSGTMYNFWTTLLSASFSARSVVVTSLSTACSSSTLHCWTTHYHLVKPGCKHNWHSQFPDGSYLPHLSTIPAAYKEEFYEPPP